MKTRLPIAGLLALLCLASPHTRADEINPFWIEYNRVQAPGGGFVPLSGGMPHSGSFGFSSVTSETSESVGEDYTAWLGDGPVRFAFGMNWDETDELLRHFYYADMSEFPLFTFAYRFTPNVQDAWTIKRTVGYFSAWIDLEYDGTALAGEGGWRYAPPPVPDSSSTALLLGAACLAVLGGRRKLSFRS